MINFIKNRHKVIFFWLLILGGYFLFRLINLTLIPMFTDEAIYLRWSQIMSGDLHYIYLPLTDGKPPLFMWLVAIGMKLAPMVDPLLVGRLTAVIMGLAGVTGIFFTSYQLFKSKLVSYISVLFYIVSPFTFFYDRFTLADSLLAAIGIWSLGLGIVLVRKLDLKTAVVLGGVIGLGLWTKSPALEFLLLLPSLLLLTKFKSWLRYFVLLFVVFIISRLIYSVILLLPSAYVINLKNLEFVVAPTQWVKNPLEFVAGNFHALFLWTIQYLTWPMGVLVLISLIYGLKQKSIAKLILIGYFAAHFTFMTFFNKTIYPRFLLMFFPLLLILAAKGIDDLKRLAIPALVLVLIFPIFVDFKILTDPINAPIADTDSHQYLNSWSAGFGLTQTRDFLAQEAKKNPKITVGMEGTFGLLPMGLELYYNRYPNLKMKPIWPEPETLPPGLDYYIIYQREKVPFEPQLQLIAKYKEGNSNDYFKLYKILGR